jgi:hypothetical protein
MNTKDLDLGEIKMKYRLFFGSVVLTILLITFQQVAGQYRNPYNGVNHTSQLAKFYDMTRTWNSDLYKAMSRYQATKDRLKDLAHSYGGSSRAGSTRTTAPANGSSTPSAPSASETRRYPITATDFKPVGARLVPDQFADSPPGLTSEQRESLRTLSNQFLTAYEGAARKNNIANAMTFLLGASLQVVTGKEVSDAEGEQMIVAFNNTMGATPQFVSMTPRDKQILYESAVVMAGMIVLFQTQGVEQKDIAMQSQAKELSRAVLNHFLGFEAR